MFGGNEQLVELLYNSGVVHGSPGEIRAAPLVSDYNISRAYAKDSIRVPIVEALAETMRDTRPLCVVGVGYSGVPWASMVAQHKHLTLANVERGSGAIKMQVDGYDFKRDGSLPVAIVGSVLWTGGHVKTALDVLRDPEQDLGVNIVGYYSILRRTDKIPLGKEKKEGIDVPVHHLVLDRDLLELAEKEMRKK